MLAEEGRGRGVGETRGRAPAGLVEFRAADLNGECVRGGKVIVRIVAGCAGDAARGGHPRVEEDLTAERTDPRRARQRGLHRWIRSPGKWFARRGRRCSEAA